MGIIQKQSSKATLYIYLGVAVGFVNSALLFPHFLPAEDKGVLDIITSLCLITAAIFSLGVPFTTLRLYPYFRDDKNHNNGYLSFLLGGIFIGLLIGVIPLTYFFSNEFPVGSRTLYYFILIVVTYFFRLVFNNLDALNRMQFNAVLGVMSSNFLLKLVSLVGISLYALDVISFDELALIHALALSTPGILSLIFTCFSSKISFNFKSFKQKVGERDLKKEVVKTSFYGFLGAAGGVVLLEFDKLVLADLMSGREVGIYATAAFFGIMVNLPARALRGIASVVIANSWKNNDLNNIQDVYQKSTLNLQVISSFLFIGIVLCSKYVFVLMKPEYSEGLNIIVFIAIAQLVDAITSVNTDILSTSKHYKYQTYFMFALIVLVVGLNYALIPHYGMVGAAISTMISVIVVNLFRTTFIYFKLGLHPFSRLNVINVLVAILVFVLAYFVNDLPIENQWLQFLATAGFITVIYWTIVLLFNLAPDLKEVLLRKVLKRP